MLIQSPSARAGGPTWAEGAPWLCPGAGGGVGTRFCPTACWLSPPAWRHGPGRKPQLRPPAKLLPPNPLRGAKTPPTRPEPLARHPAASSGRKRAGWGARITSTRTGGEQSQGLHHRTVHQRAPASPVTGHSLNTTTLPDLWPPLTEPCCPVLPVTNNRCPQQTTKILNRGPQHKFERKY